MTMPVKTFTDYMVEEINQVTNQSTETVFKELCLVAFLISYFVVVHHPYLCLRIGNRKRVGMQHEFGLAQEYQKVGSVREMDVGSRSSGRGERWGRMVSQNCLGEWARRAESSCLL